MTTTLLKQAFSPWLPHALLIWVAAVSGLVLAKDFFHYADNPSVPFELLVRKPVTNNERFLFFEPINFNTASIEELKLIKGIGEKTAWRLIEFRTNCGFILSIEELTTLFVGPVSEQKMQQIRQYLR